MYHIVAGNSLVLELFMVPGTVIGHALVAAICVMVTTV